MNKFSHFPPLCFAFYAQCASTVGVTEMRITHIKSITSREKKISCRLKNQVRVSSTHSEPKSVYMQSEWYAVQLCHFYRFTWSLKNVSHFHIFIHSFHFYFCVTTYCSSLILYFCAAKCCWIPFKICLENVRGNKSHKNSNIFSYWWISIAVSKAKAYKKKRFHLIQCGNCLDG